MYGVPHHSKKTKGGKVEGPGTGTSDSIKKDVATGSFIMPADSTARLGINQEMLRKYKEGQAAKEGPRLGMPGFNKKVPVNLSNGEYELPPEQVHAVGVQALNQAKDATHTPVAGRGVNVEAFKQFKQGKGGGPRLGVPGQNKPEQFFADGGLVDDPEKRKRLGITDGLAGGAKALLGAALVPQAAIADSVRSGAARLTGGDPATLEGGAGKFRDMATGLATEGWDQAKGASEQIRASGREALGVQPLVKPAAGVPAVAGSPAAATGGRGVPMARTARPEPRLGVPGWNKTGVGAGAQGGEIAGRVGARGVPEFTNDPSAVATATPGGVGRVGNGAGTFSQGEAGDSQLAYDRNERAIAEREKMIQASRRGAIGEGGGRLTVVADSSRAPSIAEIMRSRQENQQAQTQALQAQTEQGIAAGNQRMNTEQLQQEKLQQDLATGQFSVQDRQRLADLQAQIADPALSPDARAAAEQAYAALTVTPTERASIARDAITQQQKQQRVMADLFKTYNELGPVGEDGKTPIPFEQWAQPVLQGEQTAQSATPEGMTLIGHKDGKPVYQGADGKRYM